MPRKGENIFKRKDGRWEGRYIKARDGNKAVYGYVFGKSYLEVKQKKAEALSRIDHDKIQVKKQIQAKSLTFENIARQWLEELKPIRKKSTIVKYMGQLKNYIIPAFGNYKLNEISNENIISFSRKLLTEEQQGRKLAPKTVSDILSRMKSIRRFALLRGYEVSYIPNVVEIPFRQRQIRILTIFEENKILRYLKNHFDLTALGILLSLFTGLRIGELCALKWSDFSFADKEFYVQRTMQRLHNLDDDTERKTTIEIGEPKSQSSIRKIPIPDELLNFLKNAYVADAYVLSGLKNKFVEPRTMENRFKSVLKKCGVEKINFHALRHTFATRCVELGFDIKSLSEILGHANVNITLNRYVHPSMKLKHANMNKLNSFICSQNSYLGDTE
ncbi:MAG: site-specific integrase [Synergistaceae bacterium]|nr:site-specific integrase [Synergistaceae bacterium]